MGTVRWVSGAGVCLLLLCLAGGPFWPGAAAQERAPRPGKAADKAAELKALLKERRQALDAALRLTLEMYKAGKAPVTEVIQAEQAARKAAVDAADTPEERLAALRKSRDTAADLAQVAQELFKVGRVTQAELLRARAELLEARIALLREELKGGPRK